MGPGLPEGPGFVPWAEGGMGVRRAQPRTTGRASEEGKRSGGGVSTPETPVGPGVRAAGPGPAPAPTPHPGGSCLTRTVIAVHGEVFRLPLIRDVVARDVGDRERLLPRTHPVVPVQFELLFLYLENQTMSWRFRCLLHQPPNARGRPARPPPASRGPGVQLQPSTPTQRASCGAAGVPWGAQPSRCPGSSQPRGAGRQETDKHTGTRQAGV